MEQALREKEIARGSLLPFSAFTVHVPPLRQRREEIPLLLRYCMNQMARRYGLPARPFSPAVLEACQAHPWPGNLRELETFVKRYLVIEGDEELAMLNGSMGGMAAEKGVPLADERAPG